MPRELSPAVEAQVTGPRLRPAFFVSIAFPGDPVFIWGGLGKISSPGPPASSSATFPYGQTFIGMGQFGQIKTVPMVADVVAQNVTLELSGIPTELVTDAINAVRLSAVATIWLGCLDQNNQIIRDPVQLFQGALDVPTIMESGETCTISITAENELIDLNRAPGGRYTDVDQQQRYPGDIGFAQVQLLQDYLVTWPSPVGTVQDGSHPPPDHLTITPGQNGPIVIGVGGQQLLTQTAVFSDGSSASANGLGGPIYSSNPAVADVDANGNVTGYAPGMCVITKRYVLDIYSGGGGDQNPSSCITASVTIIVTEPQ